MSDSRENVCPVVCMQGERRASKRKLDMCLAQSASLALGDQDPVSSDTHLQCDLVKSCPSLSLGYSF